MASLLVSDNNSLDMEVTLNPSTVQSFYANKNVFITGATGFMGKILLEKLLYSCPDIGYIYITARNKKGVNLESRVDDLLNNVIFDRLKKLRPDFRSKVKVLAGEFSMPNLGLSEQDMQTLIDQVHILFHSAATVKFNEPLANALLLNVSATKSIVEMAKKMKNLKAFIHVSTAFCHPHFIDLIEEKFYDVPYDPDALLKLSETTKPEDFEKLTPTFLQNWPNTYTYTKALAEEFIRKHAVGLPVGVFRPTIVVSSVNEPLPCWCDNWYGITGYVASAGVGFLRTIMAKKHCFIPIVPVDMSINAMIVSAWDVAEKYDQLQPNGITHNPTESDIVIYNNTCKENKITWLKYYEMIREHGVKTPPATAMWYPITVFNEGKISHEIVKVALHWIPAFIVDGLRLLVGKKPQLVSVYKRFEKFESAIAYFITRNWYFDDSNMKRLSSKLSDKDSKIFFCDLKKLQWDSYLNKYFLGIRRYLLKEDDVTIPAAKRKFAMFYIAHTLLKFVLGALIVKFSYTGLLFMIKIILSMQRKYKASSITI